MRPSLHDMIRGVIEDANEKLRGEPMPEESYEDEAAVSPDAEFIEKLASSVDFIAENLGAVEEPSALERIRAKVKHATALPVSVSMGGENPVVHDKPKGPDAATESTHTPVTAQGQIATNEKKKPGGANYPDKGVFKTAANRIREAAFDKLATSKEYKINAIAARLARTTGTHASPEAIKMFLPEVLKQAPFDPSSLSHKELLAISRSAQGVHQQLGGMSKKRFKEMQGTFSELHGPEMGALGVRPMTHSEFKRSVPKGAARDIGGVDITKHLPKDKATQLYEEVARGPKPGVDPKAAIEDILGGKYNPPTPSPRSSRKGPASKPSAPTAAPTSSPARASAVAASSRNGGGGGGGAAKPSASSAAPAAAQSASKWSKGMKYGLGGAAALGGGYLLHRALSKKKREKTAGRTKIALSPATYAGAVIARGARASGLRVSVPAAKRMAAESLPFATAHPSPQQWRALSSTAQGFHQNTARSLSKGRLHGMQAAMKRPEVFYTVPPEQQEMLKNHLSQFSPMGHADFVRSAPKGKPRQMGGVDLASMMPKTAADLIREAVLAKMAGEDVVKAQISAAREANPGSLLTYTANDPAPNHAGGGNEARKLIQSNRAAIAFKPKDAVAPQKAQMKQVLDEPMMSAQHDSTLRTHLQNADKAGVKIAAVQSFLRKKASEALTNGDHQKVAGEQEDVAMQMLIDSFDAAKAPPARF